MKKSVIFTIVISLVLINLSESMKCNNDDDCLDLYHCNSEKKCIHKDIFPLTWREIVGCIVIAIMVGLANAGGIGGGPVMVLIIKYIYK